MRAWSHFEILHPVRDDRTTNSTHRLQIVSWGEAIKLSYECESTDLDVSLIIASLFIAFIELDNTPTSAKYSPFAEKRNNGLLTLHIGDDAHS